MLIRRVWAMPNKNTFDISPIGEFVKKYLRASKTSIDPFAGNKLWATYTNDLNPKSPAEHHMDAIAFLQIMFCKEVQADLVIFDPPYSPRQVKECYEGIGRKMTQEDGQRTFGWTPEKDLINEVLTPGGIFLYFGWNSVGMGKSRGFKIEELLLVCHGTGHSDTICMAERKLVHQPPLFGSGQYSG